MWSPLPPARSGIADYVAEQVPALARHADVYLVAPDPAAVDPAVRALAPVHAAEAPPEVDLDVYHLGNSPEHAFAYRAALARPGVAVLHEWSLHHLVLHETVQRGDVSAYLREMRRAHGAEGTFVARQVARALGGDLLPALYPLADRVLEASLGVVALTEWVRARAARRAPFRKVLRLPHHLSLPAALPSREDARAALGFPAYAVLVTAPGLATANKGLDVALRALARVAAKIPRVQLVVAGAVDDALPLARWAEAAGVGQRVHLTGRLEAADFVRHLAAADVVLALRFPTHGEISGALIRALGLGRPCLVTAGTPPSEEFPAGVVIPVDPGPGEEDQLTAYLLALLGGGALAERVGRLAREHARRHHDLPDTAAALFRFLEEVHADKPALLAALLRERAKGPSGLLGYLVEEVRSGARGLGLVGEPRDLPARLRPLLGPSA